MTFIPRQQEKYCFIACSEDRVNAGLCDCINRMRNEALRQPIDKAWDNIISEEIQELKEWNARIYARHRKTLTTDEHAAIGLNITQIINLLKNKTK